MLRLLALSLMIAAASACQTSSQPRPARLVEVTPESEAVLKRVLGEAVGRAQVQIGPVDLAHQPLIPVLPPPLGPLEGASTATPEIFELVESGRACYVRRRRDGEMFALPGLRCRAIE